MIFLNFIKNVYEKPITNIKIVIEQLFSIIMSKEKMFTLSTSIHNHRHYYQLLSSLTIHHQHYTGSFSLRKNSKSIKKKRKINTNLFAENMIV